MDAGDDGTVVMYLGRSDYRPDLTSPAREGGQGEKGRSGGNFVIF